MKHLLAHITYGLSLAVCLMPQQINAQTYSIDWDQVANGGGTSTGGAYSVAGTIGQPDAGLTLSGGAYSVIGGFWSLVSGFEKATPPTLFIILGAHDVTIYWQAQNGWSLQENPDLNAVTGWMNSSGVTMINGVNFHSLANQTSAMFFRLTRSNVIAALQRTDHR